jgi:hypothetical protein
MLQGCRLSQGTDNNNKHTAKTQQPKMASDTNGPRLARWPKLREVTDCCYCCKRIVSVRKQLATQQCDTSTTNLQASLSHLSQVAHVVQAVQALQQQATACYRTSQRAACRKESPTHAVHAAPSTHASHATFSQSSGAPLLPCLNCCESKAEHETAKLCEADKRHPLSQA